jgi:predicted nucleotidyltransferase
MDKDSLDRILNETLKRILAVIKPKKVILFGSAARGSMGANSDIDLLVVVPSGVHRRQTAQKIYRNMVGVGFAADIIVVTEEDVERYKDRPGLVIMPAMEEGRVLYAAA